MSGTENAPAMPRLLSSPPARILLQPVLLLLLSLVLGSLPRPVRAEPAPSSPVTADPTPAALPASGDLLEALPPPAAGPPAPPRQAAPDNTTDAATICTALARRCESIETDTQARARQRQELERLQRQIGVAQ